VAAVAADVPPRRKTYRVGWLDSGRVSAPYQDVVRQAVIGYPQEIAFEYRSADGRADRLQDLAAELVRLKVDIVFAVGNQAIQAAKQATSTIPIVMLGSDAATAGAVARPGESGGNLTGVTYSSVELARSWLKLLKELRPTLSRVAVLHSGDSTSRVELTNLQLAGASLGTKIQAYALQEGDAIGGVFAGRPGERAEAVIVPGGPVALFHLRRIVDLASRAGVPTIYGYSEFVDAGGLVAYGPSLPATYRRAGAYIGKILSPTNPRDLPIDQPSRFELVINLKTARALGLTVPESLILRADRVLR
jgi:putative ABC transport system substrate-binding protein